MNYIWTILVVWTGAATSAASRTADTLMESSN
ncbi:hypothetical protein VD0002_g9284 [Verticillium dahliae]|uniref:Uncharacterized protein n=1 Tax=Verticillium dahliae TaxID=27337 RepID=A0AA45APX1_VERDA|nr:hypothetical protein BJF96_g2235 [Verticillium dahliae]PNH58242.1 hypothetical protein VD0002_g9284 [Verticillium dahliae]